MLFAVAYDDRETFERMHAWTSRTLRRSTDALHAWRYIPGAPQPVADTQQCDRWGPVHCLRAVAGAFRWNRPDYARQAQAIARDVLRLLVRDVGTRTVLLPAANGFEKGDRVNLNPSYYCFAAMQELSEAVPSPLWEKLRSDGLAMLAEGRFGEWRLPPDWLSVSCRSGDLAPAPDWPARFSYDAIRVPLYLAWAGLTPPAMHEAFVKYWAVTSSRTAWVDLKTNACASYPPSSGFLAVTKVASAAGRTGLPADFPSVHAATDYYSAALTMLARLAWQEIRQALISKAGHRTRPASSASSRRRPSSRARSRPPDHVT